MSTRDGATSVLERLDQLNEYERQPLTDDKLHGSLYFAGSFAGEHVAATEFVIGALFVSAGAKAVDVIGGLVLGNILAVLSWTLICAPIAADTRLTLYWYLRKIIGPGALVVYNIVNGVLYCALGGAMITVAASAVRVLFGIPDQTKWYPESAAFVLIVLVVGAVVVTLAILGFRRLAQFATVCAPWMLLMFVAGGLLTLPMLGDARSWSGFWAVAEQKIWAGPAGGQTDALGFWHIVAFAWVCNQGMHIGLTDMALLRYARRRAYGLYSSFGMFLGHYLAWICAGIMGAAAATFLGRPLIELDSGSVAHVALGGVGILAVVIAGWTTANPMLYRAGLAFQVITPGWARWKVTLVAGAITTLIACSPFVFTKLLDFAALYGLVIMPMGAIVAIEHWVFPRVGLHRYWAARKGLLVNWPAMVAWILPLAAGIVAWANYGAIHLFFLTIPVWVSTAVLYPLLAAFAGAGSHLPELEEPTTAEVAPTADGADSVPRKRSRTVLWTAGCIALGCLVLSLVLPIRVFLSPADVYEQRAADFKDLILWITPIYFISGSIWMSRWQKLKERTAET